MGAVGANEGAGYVKAYETVEVGAEDGDGFLAELG